MFSPARRSERSSATDHLAQVSLLVVSEEPAIIHAAAETLKSSGVRVIGCLGPAHSHCNLEDHDSCPLADHATIALVDSPTTGSFTCHWKRVQSGTYAERLQSMHPGCAVILCGAPQGPAGPSGDVAHATSVGSALALLHAGMTSQSTKSVSVAQTNGGMG